MTNGLVRVAARRTHGGFSAHVDVLVRRPGARVRRSRRRRRLLAHQRQPHPRRRTISRCASPRSTGTASRPRPSWRTACGSPTTRPSSIASRAPGFNTVRIPYSDQMMSQNPVLGTMNINRNGINTDIAANAHGARRARQDHRLLRPDRPARDARQPSLQRRQLGAGKRTVVHERVPREHLARQLARAHDAIPRQHHGGRRWTCATNRTPAPAGAAIPRAAARPTTGMPPPRAPATPSSRSIRTC